MSGRCSCRPNIGGRTCDRCAENAVNTTRDGCQSKSMHNLVCLWDSPNMLEYVSQEILILPVELQQWIMQILFI